ncbi:MAG: hypothetical protein QXJ62_07530 [Nitrososphaeria archaeon]
MNEGHVITFLEELLFEIDNVVYIFLGTIRFTITGKNAWSAE